MNVRQFALASPARVVAGALVTILAFAVLYPLVGGFQETISRTGVTLVYSVEDLRLSRWKYLLNVFDKSLHLSVQTFTLAGSTGLEPVTTQARTLADLEALLGMGFLGLFTASLCRDE